MGKPDRISHQRRPGQRIEPPAHPPPARDAARSRRPARLLHEAIEDEARGSSTWQSTTRRAASSTGSSTWPTASARWMLGLGLRGVCGGEGEGGEREAGERGLTYGGRDGGGAGSRRTGGRRRIERDRRQEAARSGEKGRREETREVGVWWARCARIPAWVDEVVHLSPAKNDETADANCHYPGGSQFLPPGVF